MEDRFKKTFKISIEDDIDTKYDDNYIDNVGEIINSYLTPLKGTTKEEYFLDVLIDIFNSKYYGQKLENDFIDNLSSFDPNIIVKNILNGNLNVENISLKKLFDFFSRTKNLEFLEYFFDKNRHGSTSLPLTVNMVRTIVKDPKLLKNEKINEMLETSLQSFDIDDFTTFLEYAPFDKIGNIIKPIINTYSLPEQVRIYQRLIYSHRDKLEFKKLFEKIYDLYNKNIIILGSFHSSQKIPNHQISIIMDMGTDLYGYIDNDGKIIIPPKFNEISSANKNGVITGKVIRKIDSLEPGYYKIDETGKVLEYFDK